jgi:hypothetical protein
VSVAAHPLEPRYAPSDVPARLLQAVGQPAALRRLEAKVGRDFAGRLIAALSRSQGRRGQSE